LEHVPAASPAVLAAMQSNPALFTKSDRQEIAERKADVAPATRLAKGHVAGGQLSATEFEMAGFWGEPGPDGYGGERLKAGRFKVKLSAPIAGMVH
jgi:hypothetical protein